MVVLALMSWRRLRVARCKGLRILAIGLMAQEGIARIQATEPELIISLRFGLIIRDAVIAIPKHGVINLHSGLLPDYRGVMATFRAMLNGESEIASTLHFIQDSGVDTGDIISTVAVAVEPDKSYLLNVLNLYVGGCEQILRRWRLLRLASR